LESSALGKNEFKQVPIPGRVEFDLYMSMRRTYKLRSYKLNAVCDHFFGGAKDDVTYADIKEAYDTQDAHKLGVVAKYCYQDAWLVLRLLEKTKEVFNTMAMASLCVVPLTYIIDRGQQIKCFSLILNDIHGEYICNYDNVKVEGEEAGDDVGYQGACVIEAQAGFHDDPVVTLDFASLYPSIMQNKQLCYTTYVDNTAFLGIPGVHYEKFETFPGHFETFAYHEGEESILCKLERTMGLERKAVRRLIKTEEDAFMRSVLDGQQLAIKTAMNSLYGFTGTKTGMLPLVAIAAAVTCTGRSIIMKTKDFMEKQYNCNVVYGDSVPAHTPVYIRETAYNEDFEMVQTVSMKRIDEIAYFAGDTDTKESRELALMETWTDEGWVRLHRVIRHKLDKSKKILRIVTGAGLVEVTDEHSLITSDNRVIDAKKVKVGTRLMHGGYPRIERWDDAENAEGDGLGTLACAELAGVYFVHGMVHEHGFTLTFSNGITVSALDKVKRLLHDVYSDASVVISGGECDDVCGDVAVVVTMTLDHLLIDGSSLRSSIRVIPQSVLHGSPRVKYAFFDGATITRLEGSTPQVIQSQIALLASVLDYEVSFQSQPFENQFDGEKHKQASVDVGSKEASSGSTGVSICVDYHRALYERQFSFHNTFIAKVVAGKDASRVLSVEEVSYEGYVYDLTTENHKFAAGVGQIVVHNTDSVMVVFPEPAEKDGEAETAAVELVHAENEKHVSELFVEEDGGPVVSRSEQDTQRLKYIFEMGNKASEEASALFGPPILLEFENVYFPYLLVSKKRYCAMSWLSPEGPPKLTMKGLAVVRRDFALVVTNCMKTVINLLMERKGNAEVCQYITKTLQDITDGNIDFELLTIRKELKKWEYASATPHAELAQKMKTRSRLQPFFRNVLRPIVTGEMPIDYGVMARHVAQLRKWQTKIRCSGADAMALKDVVKLIVDDDKRKVFKAMKITGADVWKEQVQAMGVYKSLFHEGIFHEKDLANMYAELDMSDVVEWQEPKLGDRIGYIVVRGGGNVNERSEDVAFAKALGMKPDAYYYINQQLKNPLIGLLEHTMGMKDANAIFEPYLRLAKNKSNSNREITDFFAPVKKAKA
jgi:DNA polymerase elongation subunit (family B)